MQHHSLESVAADETHLDPVCGMSVSKDNAAGHHEYKGVTYYFCGTGCLERFKRDPEKYLRPAPAIQIQAPAPPKASGVEWTCPMHPEVVRKGPGSCPKCGMALEPRALTLETLDEENPELPDKSRRVVWSAV